MGWAANAWAPGAWAPGAWPPGTGQNEVGLTGDALAGATGAADLSVGLSLAGDAVVGTTGAADLSITLATSVLADFATPTGTLGGTQTFRVLVRKTGTSNPTCRVCLYEGAALVSVLSTTTVTSDTGQVISATWAATQLADQSGAAAQCFAIGTANGLSQVDFGAVAWDYALVVPLAGDAVAGASAAADLLAQPHAWAPRYRDGWPNWAGRREGSGGLSIDLAGDAVAGATAAAGLTVSTSAGTFDGGGEIRPQRMLAGAGLAGASAAGQLAGGSSVALAGGAVAGATASGTFASEVHDLAGDAVAGATADAGLSLGVSLAGDAVAGATAAGALTEWSNVTLARYRVAARRRIFEVAA
jgi:hypothetical protein